MQILTNFLTRIQTFELRIVTKGKLHSRIKEDEHKQAYSLVHETQYYDSFSYKSEMRVLKDMALIDILSLSDINSKRELEQLKKLKDRFKEFWTNFHLHYRELKPEYPQGYIFSIHLDSLFIVRNLQPDDSDIFIGNEFVESLSDSVKIREKFLTELMNEVEEVLYPRETFEEWKSRQENPQLDKKSGPDTPEKVPFHPDDDLPKFNAAVVEDFMQLIRPYFSETDHMELSKLINGSSRPDNKLTFKGNGNQLADAFKQLYEANLVVGCTKADLEKWIAKYFLYGTGDSPKEYTEGWLSAIISTDTKVCKSPILEVRIKDKLPKIIGTIRNKKNSKY